MTRRLAIFFAVTFPVAGACWGILVPFDIVRS
jgi:hypothetical protein